MKSNILARQIEHKIEDMRVQYWFPPLVLLCVSIWLWQSFVDTRMVFITQSVEETGNMQLFVDDGSGYSQEHSMVSSIAEEDGVSSHSFVLDRFSKIDSLRFDPIDNQGNVRISRLRYKVKGEWFAKSILSPEYANSNAIRFQWNAKHAELEIYPESVDPYFILDQNFADVPTRTATVKQIVTHSTVLVVGFLLSWFFSGFCLTALSLIVYCLWQPILGVRFLCAKYTAWVDRFSRKWELVNPTSCVVAGAVIAAISCFYANDAGLFDQDEQPFRGNMVVDIVSSSAKSFHLFYATGHGFRTDESKYVHFQPEEFPYQLSIPVHSVSDKIIRLRIDPFEDVGDARLENLRFIRKSGLVVPIDMRDWTSNDDLIIKDSGAHFLQLESRGLDPFAISPRIDLDVKNHATFPIRFGFPFVVWFFSSLGLLLYNRLLTEGMTHQDILNIQQM